MAPPRSPDVPDEIPHGKSGVYAICHVASGKTYVGQSCRIRERLVTHVRHLKAGIHHCAALQELFSADGLQAFKFSVLEDGIKRRRVKAESAYIARLTEQGVGILNTPLPSKNPAGGKRMTGKHYEITDVVERVRDGDT